MPVQILLIEKIGQESGGVSFAARCHAGSLKLGDLITIAIDPAGDRHTVNVTCIDIRFTPQIMVDELETNFGGLITLVGAGVSTLSSDWTLLGELSRLSRLSGQTGKPKVLSWRRRHVRWVRAWVISALS
jgi:hypothetical protein